LFSINGRGSKNIYNTIAIDIGMLRGNKNNSNYFVQYTDPVEEGNKGSV